MPWNLYSSRWNGKYIRGTETFCTGIVSGTVRRVSGHAVEKPLQLCFVDAIFSPRMRYYYIINVINIYRHDKDRITTQVGF